MYINNEENLRYKAHSLGRLPGFFGILSENFIKGQYITWYGVGVGKNNTGRVRQHMLPNDFYVLPLGWVENKKHRPKLHAHPRFLT